MEERKTVRSHILTVENRKNGKLTGVQEVDSFNENEILFLTVEGKLLIKGEQLVLSRARKKEFMEALTNYWGEVVK